MGLLKGGLQIKIWEKAAEKKKAEVSKLDKAK
jgi:hypothetical protein